MELTSTAIIFHCVGILATTGSTHCFRAPICSRLASLSSRSPPTSAATSAMAYAGRSNGTGNEGANTDTSCPPAMDATERDRNPKHLRRAFETSHGQLSIGLTAQRDATCRPNVLREDISRPEQSTVRHQCRERRSLLSGFDLCDLGSALFPWRRPR
jgi:hypothetical protein